MDFLADNISQSQKDSLLHSSDFAVDSTQKAQTLSQVSDKTQDSKDLSKKIRLDVFLTINHLSQSRNQAIELIKNGFVCVDDEIIKKPSFLISKMQDLNKVTILKKDIFVSRAGEKLDFFIKTNNINLAHLNALDIGSSKGGFTQVLLKYGVKNVVCVDVGRNQLDSTIKANPKVKIFEECDIKDFDVDIEFDIIVCDVSFISLKVILPHIRRLCKDRAILLFKPQFEVGKSTKRNKNGVVVDKFAISSSLESFKVLLAQYQFCILSVEYSQVKGKAGNEEIFIYIKKQ